MFFSENNDINSYFSLLLKKYNFIKYFIIKINTTNLIVLLLVSRIDLNNKLCYNSSSFKD